MGLLGDGVADGSADGDTRDDDDDEDDEDVTASAPDSTYASRPAHSEYRAVTIMGLDPALESDLWLFKFQIHRVNSGSRASGPVFGIVQGPGFGSILSANSN